MMLEYIGISRSVGLLNWRQARATHGDSRAPIDLKFRHPRVHRLQLKYRDELP